MILYYTKYILIYFRIHLFRIILFIKSSSSLINNNAIFVIAPHPDDEVFGIGGTIALKCSQGIDVHVIFLTYGEASLKQYSDISPDDIAFNRKKSAISACQILGINTNNLHWIGLPDGKLRDIVTNDINNTIIIINNLINIYKPKEIYIPHILDYMPDHVAANKILLFAISKLVNPPELFYYIVWAWHNIRIINIILFEYKKVILIDIKHTLKKKNAAIYTYINKLEPIHKYPYCGKLPNSLLFANKWSFEVIIKK